MPRMFWQNDTGITLAGQVLDCSAEVRAGWAAETVAASGFPCRRESQRRTGSAEESGSGVAFLLVGAARADQVSMAFSKALAAVPYSPELWLRVAPARAQ